MAGGGLILRGFTQTFAANGSWTAPAGLALPPAVYAWGEGGNSGTSVSGGAGHSGGGGGGGAFGGESALGGIHAGTVLTITIGGGGSGTNTTVTGGSVTVQGNVGANASGLTAGGGGTAGTNTIAFAGGSGGNGLSGSSHGGGGGGGSAGSTGGGGAGATGSASNAAGGTAGTGAAGPPSLAGAVGGTGATPGNIGGTIGNIPGSGGGGPGNNASNAANGGATGQVIIIWWVYQPIPAPVPRRKLARAVVEFTPVRTVIPGVPGTVQPRATVPVPRRHLARSLWRAGTGQAFVFVPAPLQEFRLAPRRKLARAVVEFTPVRTTNTVATAAPAQLRPIPRRRPGRVVWRGNAVVIPPAVAAAGGRITADYDGKSWWKKRWILRL